MQGSGKQARRQEVVQALLARVPGRFSVELGLTLEGSQPKDLFLWFLASLLYGARISGTIATRTYEEFVRHGLVTPERILATGWDGLVTVLDAGGYARYDFKTATKLLDVMRRLADCYGGDLNKLHEAAADSRDLEARLKALGPGIGNVTTQVFLRELREVWPKAQPAFASLAVLAAEHLGLLETRLSGPSPDPLKDLRRCRGAPHIRKKSFSDVESALVRLGRDYCRRQRWQSCPMREYCTVAASGNEPMRSATRKDALRQRC